MSLTRRRKHKSAQRRRPWLEDLEVRPLCSVSPTTVDVGSVSLSDTFSPQAGGYLAVTQADPAPGAVLTQSPTTVTVTFNEAVDPFSLTGMDFDLQSVAADGTVTSLSTDYATALSEPNDLFDPTTSLQLTVNQTLPAGHYRLVLLGSSFLQAANGDMLAGDGSDQDLADFSIAAPPKGVTLADATPVGPLGATPIVVPGTLDFQADPSAVSLYRVTLPGGHYWQLGVEVSATREGGTLHSGLALFDAQGHLLKTSTYGQPDFPNDPYMFAGLQPGTYYIGVSDFANVPGTPGGYDPAVGTPGVASQDPVGGPYRLSLTADPADLPVHLLGTQFQYADPASSTPTGLTLAFSGPLALDAFVAEAHGQGFHGLVLVDQSGGVWEMTPVGFQAGRTQVNFLFDEHLPPGRYTLEVPGAGGITDLAGLTPFAAGQPAGVLGSFAILPSRTPHDPNDLGVLPREVHAGLDLASTVAPGGPTTYRFVVPLTDFYTFQFDAGGAPVSAELVGPNGRTAVAAGGTVLQLDPGVYQLRLKSAGSRAADVRTSISLPPSSWERYWDNGLGQGPALNLTLVAPTAPDFPSPSSAGQPSGPAPVGSGTTGTAPTPTPSPSAPSSGGAIAPGAVPAGPAGLMVTLGNLVGNPSANSNAVPPVGPVSQGGTTALASQGAGLLQGITYGVTPLGQSSGSEETPKAPAEEDEGGLEPTDGAIALSIQEIGRGPDERALVDSEWPTRIGDVLSRWLTTTPEPRPAHLLQASAPGADAEPPLVAGHVDRLEPVLAESTAETAETVQEEQAGLFTPLGVGLATVVALRLRQPVRRLLERARKRPKLPRGLAVGISHPRA